MKKVKIVSDGIPLHTKVYNGSGEEMTNIRKIDFHIALGDVGIANIEFVCVECEIECEPCFKHAELFSDEDLKRIRDRRKRINNI